MRQRRTAEDWRLIAREVGRFLLLAVPKAGGGVFLLALNLLLVRVLDTAEFGRFAYCMTLVLLADAIIGAPFDLAVIKLSGEERAAGAEGPMAAARAALHVKLAVTAGLLVAVAGLDALVGAPEERGGLLAATLLAITSMLVVRSVQVTLQVSGRFLAYASIESLQLVLRIALIAAAVLLLPPGAALALAALGAGALLAAAWGGLVLQPGLLRISGRGGLPYARLSGIAFWVLATTAVGALIGRLDVLALGWLAPASGIGLFTAGQVIASIAELGGSYLAVFLTPRLVGAMRAGETAALYRRVQPALLALAGAGLAGAILIGPLLLPLVLPPAYALSGTVALILMPGALAAFATVPLALPLVLFRHKRALLVLDLALFPFVAAAYALAIAGNGVIGAAIVTTSVMLLRSAAVQGIALWSLRRPVPPQNE